MFYVYFPYKIISFCDPMTISMWYSKLWGAVLNNQCVTSNACCEARAAVYTYLHISVWWTVGLSVKTWLLTAKLCSRRNGGKSIPSRTGNVRRNSSSSVNQTGSNAHYTHQWTLVTVIPRAICKRPDWQCIMWTNFKEVKLSTEPNTKSDNFLQQCAHEVSHLLQ